MVETQTIEHLTEVNRVQQELITTLIKEKTITILSVNDIKKIVEDAMVAWVCNVESSEEVSSDKHTERRKTYSIPTNPRVRTYCVDKYIPIIAKISMPNCKEDAIKCNFGSKDIKKSFPYGRSTLTAVLEYLRENNLIGYCRSSQVSREYCYWKKILEAGSSESTLYNFLDSDIKSENIICTRKPYGGCHVDFYSKRILSSLIPCSKEHAIRIRFGSNAIRELICYDRTTIAVTLRYLRDNNLIGFCKSPAERNAYIYWKL